MPHDHSALLEQLGELLTQQRYNAVVVRRNADYFLYSLAHRKIVVRGRNTGRSVEFCAARCGVSSASAPRLQPSML